MTARANSARLIALRKRIEIFQIRLSSWSGLFLSPGCMPWGLRLPFEVGLAVGEYDHRLPCADSRDGKTGGQEESRLQSAHQAILLVRVISETYIMDQDGKECCEMRDSVALVRLTSAMIYT